MLYENPDLYDTLLPVSAQQLHFYVALAQRRAGPEFCRQHHARGRAAIS